MNENKFQSNLIKEIECMFPECVIINMDGNYIQGFPDLLILYKERWAALECKRNKNSPHQPNQDYYVDMLNEMSYSSFVYPEIKEEVLYELQQALQTRR